MISASAIRCTVIPRLICIALFCMALSFTLLSDFSHNLREATLLNQKHVAIFDNKIQQSLRYLLPTSYSTKAELIRIGLPEETTVTSANIVKFWRVWAKLIQAARPQAKKITYKELKVEGHNNDHTYRLPYKSMQNIDGNDVKNLTTAHEAFKKSLDDVDFNNSAYHLFYGSGVVIVAGGDYFGPAVVGIRMLRNLGSILPAEVFLQDANEYDREICEVALRALDARCIIMTDFQVDLNRADGEEALHIEKYQLKAAAILLSSFETVVYMDADSIPLMEPQKHLLDTSPFNDTGLVIWPDFWIATEDPIFYHIVGMEGFPNNTLPKSSTESGQLLISKQKHLKSLLLANYYNIHGYDHYYPLLSQGAPGQGDKETFLAAAVVCGEPFYFVKEGVSAAGYHADDHFEGTGMVQWLPLDDQVKYTTGDKNIVLKPAFLHANRPRMNPAHILESEHVFNPVTGKRQRIWGNMDSDLIKKFGVDIEKLVWEQMVEVGCDIGHILTPHSKLETKLCEELRKHWYSVFINKKI